MTVISINLIKKQTRTLTVFFLLIFCALPFQKPFKGILKHFSRHLIPSDLNLPPGFSKSIPFYVSDIFILLFVGCLFFYFRPSLKKFCFEGASKYLFFLASISVMSILFSETRHYLTQYLKLFHFVFYFILFNSIASLKNLISSTSLVYMFSYVLLGIGLFEGGVAILQYFTQKEVGLSLLGEFSLNHFPFTNEKGALYLGGSSQASVLFRSSGTFSHPNVLGATLFCSLLSTAFLFCKEQKKWLGGVLILCLFFQMGAFATTFSRSAFLALFVSIAIFFLLSFKVQKMNRKRLFVFIGSLLFIGFLGLSFLSPAILSRGGILNYNAIVGGADLERMQYAEKAFNMVKEHPWLGVGFNNFQLYPLGAHLGALFSKVHNIYLLVASETGILGLSCFLMFIFSLLYSAYLVLRRDLFSIEMAFLVSGFIGLLLVGCFDFFLLEVSAGALLLFGFAVLLHLTSYQSLRENNDS